MQKKKKKMKKSKQTFVHIPHEIVQLIFSYVPGNKVASVLNICKDWYNVLNATWPDRLELEFYKHDRKEQELKDKQQNDPIFGRLFARRTKRDAPFKELPSFFSPQQRYKIRYLNSILKCYKCLTFCRPKNQIEETKMCLCDTCHKTELINITNVKKRFCLKPAEMAKLTRYQTFGYFVAEVEQYFETNFSEEELDSRRDKRDKRASNNAKLTQSNEINLRAMLKEKLTADKIIPDTKISKLVAKYNWQAANAKTYEAKVAVRVMKKKNFNKKLLT